MIKQFAVQEHANKMDSGIDASMLVLSQAVKKARVLLLRKAVEEADNPKSFALFVSTLEDDFTSIFKKAGYFAATVAVISGLWEEVESVKKLWQDMGLKGEFSLSDRQWKQLEMRAEAALSILDSRVTSEAFKAKLRLMPLVGADPVIADIVEDINTSVDAIMSEDLVKNMIQDMTMDFFRHTMALGYDNLDEPVVLYYAGPRDQKNRKFCRKLIDSGRRFTLAEIRDLDNGQGSDVLLNGGGHGCRHWWAGED